MLYHKDVFMPRLNLPKGRFKLTYGNHAKRAAETDEYTTIILPAYLDTNWAEVIEVEVINGKPVKIVYRKPFDFDRDLIIVINTKDFFVKTVWINEANDKHNTLNTSRYVRA